MRRIPAAVLAFACLAAGGPASFAAPNVEPARDALRMRIAVEFLSDGRCTVSANGATTMQSDFGTRSGSSASSSDFACAIPATQGNGPVDLEVALPGGAPPSPAGFPRLSWTRRDSRWFGTASLPAAPAFVHLPAPESSAARNARWLDALALAAMAGAIGWTIVYSVRSSSSGERGRR
jgi:hypothetical protein